MTQSNVVEHWVLPLDRAVCVVGGPGDAIAVALDDMPDDGPAVVKLRVEPSDNRAAIMRQVLDVLTNAAMELFPAWLPDASAISGRSSLDIEAVRIHARRLASASDHYGPFLSDLAERALGFPSARRRFTDAEVAEGLAAILGASWQRGRVALLLSCQTTSVRQQVTLAYTSEWLAARGFAVWLVDTPVPDVDRLPSIHVDLPDYLKSIGDDGSTRAAGVLEYWAVAGRPHPGSAVEKLIDRELAKHSWASPRRLNHAYQNSPIAQRYFLDIVWLQDRFVVELDGYEHRSTWRRAKDNLRDNLLRSWGFHVMRIPNERVLANVWEVIAEIDAALRHHRELRNPNTLTAPKEGLHP